MKYKGILLLFMGASTVQDVAAHCRPYHPHHCVNKVVKEVKRVEKRVEKEINRTDENLEKLVEKTGNALEEARDDVKATLIEAGFDTQDFLEEASDDIGNVLEEAVRDTKEEAERTGKNVGGALVASANFLENQVHSIGSTLKNTHQKLSRGQLASAIWYLAVEPLKDLEDDLSKAVIESSLLNNLGTAAASIYGGSAGASAYAAWYTYKQTGDLQLSLKTGIIVGATKEGLTLVNGMPTNTADELIAKTLATASIGGTAIAASGGTEEDVIAGFVKGAAYSVAREYYTSMTNAQIEGRAPNQSAIAKPKLIPGKTHSFQILRDENGFPILDSSGKYFQIDITSLPQGISHVGLATTDMNAGFFSGQETSALMQGLARLPYVNDMAYFHDQWAAVAQMSGIEVQTTIFPAMALTVTGSDTPLFNQIQNVNIRRSKGEHRVGKNFRPANVHASPSEYQKFVNSIGAQDLYGFTPDEIRLFKRYRDGIGKVKQYLVNQGLEEVAVRANYNANIYRNMILASINQEELKYLAIRAKDYVKKGGSFSIPLTPEMNQEYINVWNNSVYNKPILASMGDKTIGLLKDLNVHPKLGSEQGAVTLEIVDIWGPQQAPTAPAFSTTDTEYKDTIYVTNKCESPLFLAIRYSSWYQSWTSKGFWELSPGEGAFLADSNGRLRSAYQHIYFVAFSRETDDIWVGSHDMPLGDRRIPMMRKILKRDTNDSLLLNLECKFSTAEQAVSEPNEPLPDEYEDTLYFTNECHNEVKIAVRYKDAKQGWRTRGWWTFDGDESAYLTSNGDRLKLDSSIVYFYGEGTKTFNFWLGDDDKPFRNDYLPMKKTKLSRRDNNSYKLGISCKKQ